jgi:hypothetical protein
MCALKKKYLGTLLTLFCVACSGQQQGAVQKKIIDDRSSVRSFSASVGEAGHSFMVLATRDSDSTIYRSYVSHGLEISKRSLNKSQKKYLDFEVIDYHEIDASYSLLVPEKGDNGWFLLCPLDTYAAKDSMCIIYGKSGDYVLQAYISDIDIFQKIIQAISNASSKSLK